ncbi:unnamed protein product, partial [Rotaria magnacalcarata]
SSFLVVLKDIAQHTDQFKWNQMKSLTIGKNMINHQNLLAFIPSHVNDTYSMNLNHLRIIIYDHRVLESHDRFRRSIRKLVKTYSKLTSLIIEFTKRYEGLFRLRNQLHALFELNINKKIHVYPTAYDYACRFCFDTNFSNEEDDESDETSSSQKNRTFCGIPICKSKTQRKSNSFP